MLGTLLRLHDLNGTVRLANPITRIQQKLKVLRLDSVFEIFDSEQQAVRNFGI